MKKIAFISLCILFAGVPLANAQLFQKLKDKVASKVSGNSQQNNATANGATGTAQPFTDFAKYNISTTVAVPQTGIAGKNHSFNNQYSVYKMGPGGPVVDAMVFATDRPIGEATIYDQSDQAYIYENGTLAGNKTVGQVEADPSLNMYTTRRDYPQLYSGSMMEFSTDGNPYHLTINGKTYANYMMITSPTISKDKTKFYAIGAENGNDGLTYYLFWSGGRVKLPGMASGIMVNADFSAGGAYGFTSQMNTSDNATSSDVMQSAGNALSHSDVYFASGSVVKSGGMTYNAWLDPTGKNILAANLQNGNYVNGKQISTEGSQPGDLWSGADGTHWAYYKSVGSGQPGHLKFYDGADIPNAVNPRQLSANGKSYIVWLQYKDLYSGDLLFCTREL